MALVDSIQWTLSCFAEAVVRMAEVIASTKRIQVRAKQTNFNSI